MSIKTVIVDDEPLARRSIRRFLKHHPDVEVLHEAADGMTAVNIILGCRPDLLFLDVQMPELDGFAVINQVGIERMPVTIFITAYDQYALAAFDANAADYLLKPFGKVRFDRAMARVRERLSGSADRESLKRLLQTIGRERTCADTVPVMDNGRIVFVKTREIRWIESVGNYARLHLGSGHHDVRETLTNLEGKLSSSDFVRIHRSIIVNLHYVKEVQPWFHGYHLVLLEGGQRLRMSRYQKDVAERFGLRRNSS